MWQEGNPEWMLMAGDNFEAPLDVCQSVRVVCNGVKSIHDCQGKSRKRRLLFHLL